MISCIEEYREAKRILEEAKAELSSAGKPYKAEIPVGIMVEVPPLP
jgi:phosphotransferase system enzyme I (PtsI)